jgi:hypothetical protein
MTCLLDVAPYDGGWCVKIGDTGEVLFFPGRRRALAEAHGLARAWPTDAEVRVRPRTAEARSFEAWADADLPSPIH